MAVFNGAFPILPGKEQGGRDFAAAVMGERRKEFETEKARSGVTRATWALQETPMGSFMLVWFEAPDIERAFTDLATVGNEFSTWFLGQVKDVTGVDLGSPPESPPPTCWSIGPPETRPPLASGCPLPHGPKSLCFDNFDKRETSVPLASHLRQRQPVCR
jgi:hypothetical protein